MQFEYVYADLQVSIDIKADNESYFGRLTDGQVQALGQWFYLTLNCMRNAEAIRQIDLIDKHKYDYLKNEGSQDNE